VQTYRLTPSQRVAVCVLVAALELLLLNWPAAVGHALSFGWQVVIVVITAAATWWMVSRPGLDVEPGVGFVIRSVLRADYVPFDHVQAVEVVTRLSGGETVVIHSRLGSWSLTAPFRWTDAALAVEGAAIRDAWRSSGAPTAAPGVEAWGPDPGSGDGVVMRPRPRQVFFGLPNGSLASFARYLTTYLLVTAVAWTAHGQLTVGVAALGLLALEALFVRGPRTIVGSDGVEFRRLVRTTFVPWSMVRAVTTSESRPRARTGPAIVVIGLVTASHWFELPAPRGGLAALDPQFWRKLQFIEARWKARRGSSWVGPPAPPSVPLPPPPPPPAAGPA
jgi:hypothetical protein